jgi:hypothetical protein
MIFSSARDDINFPFTETSLPFGEIIFLSVFFIIHDHEFARSGGKRPAIGHYKLRLWQYFA